MKQIRTTLWVSTGERGQRQRPVFVHYVILPVGSPSLYGVQQIVDAHTGAEYPVELTLSINNGDMDEVIAASDPVQVKFAKEELKKDLKVPTKPKTLKKPVAQLPEPDQFDLPLTNEEEDNLP